MATIDTVLPTTSVSQTILGYGPENQLLDVAIRLQQYCSGNPHSAALTISTFLRSMRHLPVYESFIVRGRAWRKPRAIPALSPPIGRQPFPIIRPDPALRLQPVDAGLAAREAWSYACRDYRALAASVARAYQRPEDEFELLRPRRRRVPVTAAVGRWKEHAGSAARRKGMLHALF